MSPHATSIRMFQHISRFPGPATFLFLIMFSAFHVPGVAAAPDETLINWQTHDAAAFQKAREEEKYILLYLEAVWCHWCHVMEAKTYSDPAVAQLIENHYVPLKVDHDARPDLAERYRRYGWPATIVLTADGTEIVKRAGYIARENMLSLLQAIVADSSPEAGQIALPATFSSSPLLQSHIRAKLETRHGTTYDPDHGGLNIMQKFLDADAVEWALHEADAGNETERDRSRQTLDAAIKLIDPEFGGAYQYSTHGDWEHPHYEKILRTQGRYLRIYALAYQRFGDPNYRQAAEKVASWLHEFMTAPSGAFYASQDADLNQGEKAHDYFRLSRSERLGEGLPRIDKNLYSGENGMIIEGLAHLFMATDEDRYLQAALKATHWIMENRAYAGGGFRHSKIDHAGPYLSDTLHMGRAFLALYAATGDEIWLKRADRAAGFIDRYFKHKVAGLVTAVDNGTPVTPLPQIDQNISTVRFLTALAEQPRLHTSRNRNLDLAAHALRFLVTEDVALSRLSDPGILMAEHAYRRAQANSGRTP